MKRALCLLLVSMLGYCAPVGYAQSKAQHAKPSDVRTYVPANAAVVLPHLKEMLEAKWPTYAYPQFIAAQIEQETCVSLTHSKCWTSRAELITKREHGVSFGQFTIAYHADGSERFNAFNDVRRLDKDLLGWTWANRQDVRYGLMALVVRDRSEHAYVTGAATPLDQAAFAFSGYNGGRGSVTKDRVFCRAHPPCDPNVWLGNVELNSYKPKVAVTGYSKSWYQINREYVFMIEYLRSPKYVQFFSE